MLMIPFVDTTLTTPAYSVSEVAHLVRIHPRRARRWLMGYKFQDQSGERWSPPLRSDGSKDASFLDLMELLYANAFMDSGFSLQAARKALEEARRVTGMQHPFATRAIYLAPNDIFLPVNREGDAELRSLLNKGQTGIRPVIIDISRRLEFGEDGYVTKWFPQGRDAHVVVDPRNLGGRPRIEGTRLSTRDIVALWRAADCQVEVVAADYRLNADTVRAAIDFENATALAA